MRFRPLASLRGRLGIGVIAILLFGVLTADLATYVIARQIYDVRISESLEVITNRLLAGEGRSGGPVYTSDPQSVVLTDPYIALYSITGQLISERLPVLPDGLTPPDIPGPDVLEAGPQEIEGTGESDGLVVQARQLTEAEQFEVVIDGQVETVGSLVVGLTSARVQETFRTLVGAQVTVGVVILLVAIGGAFVLLRIGLRPLVRVARTAEEISQGNLTQRIPVDEPGSEIGAVSVALNDAFDKVEQSEVRMRGFVADASHELRTPLATIRGWADLYLSNGIREWSDVDLAMNRIRTESDRMTDLVEQLLALARIDAETSRDLQPVDLVEVVQDVVGAMTAQSNDQLLTCSISRQVHRLGNVMSDEMLIRQILMNLISNSFRHTPPGTAVVVSLELEPDSGHVLMRVADNGPGMDAEQLVRAYDRFWRAEPGRGPSGGTGLGLSIVRSSVHALGGTIVLECEEGSGLTISMRLPTAQRP